MILIGLTGGIASGKSFVAQLLAERGGGCSAVVLDADRHAHDALAEPAVRAALVERWGEEILDAEGALRRGVIAKRVFGQNVAATTERRFLEGLVHPLVRERLKADLAAAEAAGTQVAVLDIPLLYEADWAQECDFVLFVETPEATRQSRAAVRGWSTEELSWRETTQLPIEEKRARADTIVPGDDAEAAEKAIQDFWHAKIVSKKET